jgi:flagellar hook-associated protein 3 FlgL
MRIATHSVSETIVRQIQQLGTQQSRLQNQVATGQRIFQPEDDPSAVSRVLKLETEARQLAQFARNGDRALEISQATFSGLRSLKAVSDRATEIGTLGSGANSADGLKAYAIEVDQLIEQALQLGNTRLGNDSLYAGTAVDAAPFVATRDGNGRIATITYAGNSDRSAIPLSVTSTVTPGTDGATNSGLRDFLQHLVALRDSLEAGDRAALTTAQEGLIDSENLLVSALGEHGGVQSRIEAARTQQTELQLSLESLVSGETDADLPSTIVKLTQSQTAYQAALQSAANIMRLSLLDYIK